MPKKCALLVVVILSASASLHAMDPETQRTVYQAINRQAQRTADGLMQLGFERHEIQEPLIKEAWNGIRVFTTMDLKAPRTENCSLKFHNLFAEEIFRFITSEELKALASRRFATPEYQNANLTLETLGRYLVPAPHRDELVAKSCDMQEVQEKTTKCMQALKLGSWIIETVKRVSHDETITAALKHLDQSEAK